MQQMNIFDFLPPQSSGLFKIDKPIRLIELFAGVGSQSKALKRLGADFAHYRVCEFDKYAINSYNAIHGTNFAKSDIRHITARDLGIVDTDKYCYIMTYSFPCQDLSLAGKQKGMAKGGNTRSSLLWEVERLLNECEVLPQVLLMENVTQVHGAKNKVHFDEWISFLESKGYSNYWKDLNSKGFGVPQNRDRTFMVSILGKGLYVFPQEFTLELRLKDMLEDSVDKKYYLSDTAVNRLFTTTFVQSNFEHRAMQKQGLCCTLCARDYKDPICVVEEPTQIKILGNYSPSNHDDSRIVDADYIAPTVKENHGTVTAIAEPRVIGGIGEKKSNGGTQWYQQDRIYDNNIAISVTTAFNPYYIEDPAINKVDIPQTVRVRKYEVDTDRLCETLRSHKAKLRLNNQHIADELTVPLTKVEHWFRQDKYFAIPDEDIWLGLKQFLGIETDEFDDAIMTFEEKEGVFEKSNRCYHSNGLAPTITSGSADEKVIEPLAYDEQNGYIRKDGTVGTLTTDGSSPKHNNRVIEDMRIRKLTPKECWRLMGFDDEDFHKAEKVNSNTQLYKQAGNSIVVDVLVHIFKQML